MRRREFLKSAAGAGLALNLPGRADAGMQNIKCVIVGDQAVGKTAAGITFTTNAFPGEYLPTVNDNYAMNLMHDVGPVNLSIWDTPGSEVYDRLRPLNYPDARVIMVAFSVVSQSSFESVETRWLPEVNHHAFSIPKILIGTKMDLRDDDMISHVPKVSREEAEEYAQRRGFGAYRECSALENDGLREAFHAAISLAAGRDPDAGDTSSIRQRMERPIDPSVLRDRPRTMTRPRGGGG